MPPKAAKNLFFIGKNAKTAAEGGEKIFVILEENNEKICKNAAEGGEKIFVI